MLTLSTTLSALNIFVQHPPGRINTAINYQVKWHTWASRRGRGDIGFPGRAFLKIKTYKELAYISGILQRDQIDLLLSS